MILFHKSFFHNTVSVDSAITSDPGTGEAIPISLIVGPGLAIQTKNNLQSLQHKNVKDGETDTDEEMLMAYWGILN